MKKFTLKLDAICAKLKEGLAGPLGEGEDGPVNGESHLLGKEGEGCLAGDLPDSSGGGASPCRSSANELDSESNNSQDEGGEVVNGFLDTPSTGAAETKPMVNGHAEASQALCGASKRKARLKLAPRRIVDAPDARWPPVANGVATHGEEGDGRTPGKTLDKGYSGSSQGSNISDSTTSMQNTASRPDALDSANTHGNNHVHNAAAAAGAAAAAAAGAAAGMATAEGAFSDRSSPSEDLDRYATPLWYAEDYSQSEDGDYREGYPEDPVGASPTGVEEEETANGVHAHPADLSNLKAIQEYAERSMTHDQSGLPIEEGLATNDVICELQDAKEEAEVDAQRSASKKSRRVRPTEEEEDDGVEADGEDEDYAVPADYRAMPLKIPVPYFGKTDKHGNPYDPTIVQEYASDTMNELIGMYGFDEGAGPDMAKDLPLDSFSFNNIQKMDEKNAGRRKKDALQKYIQRRANLHVPDLARLHAAHVGGTSPPSSVAAGQQHGDPDAHSLLQQGAAAAAAAAAFDGSGCEDLEEEEEAEEGSPSQGNSLGSDAAPQLAAQAGVGGKVASLPPRASELSAGRPAIGGGGGGKASKTVKDLINEQKGREEGVEPAEEDDEFRPRRFSKYDFFIQSLEAGLAIDYSAHRISKYDSYIRKLKAGEAIHKIIGRRQSASQKIRDIISTQIRSKHEQGSSGGGGGEALQGEEAGEEAGGGPQVSAETFNLLVNSHLQQQQQQQQASRAASASKYSYYLDKLRKGEELSPYEVSGLSDLASGSEAAAAAANGMVSHSSNGLMDYACQAPGTAAAAAASGSSGGLGEQGSLVIAEEPEQQPELSFGEGTIKRTISNGMAKMVKDEITPGEMNVFSKYITRFSGSTHCGYLHCVYQFKEHYHCVDEGCNFARFTRKEDVVRHYNWHKRRDNSLQHGFMRFSPSDNCSPYYPDCTINLKHTHYHCLQSGCYKVYTSTSDVLTHENFHKKNLSLINEGFQRFRATEDCGVPCCTFYGHKTTHFHCRRPGCDFVFKNKCDIEKHKTYHVKDDIYRKDGFKKFSKHEKCKYNWCKYSNNTNHFHCIRKNCGFVFTAANQMQSHKRKHDRRQRILEYEAARHQRGVALRLIRPKPTPSLSAAAARQLREVPETVLIQADGSVLPQRVKPLDYLASPPPSTSVSGSTTSTASPSSASTSGLPDPAAPGVSALLGVADQPAPPYTSREHAEGMASEGLNDSLNLPVASHISPPHLGPTVSGDSAAISLSSVALPPPAAAAAASIALATAASQSTLAPSRPSTNTFSSSGMKTEGKPEEPWQKYLKRFTANDPCRPRCELLYKDHYHCTVEDCGAVYKSKEGVNKHARYHMLSDEANDLGFQYFQQGESCEEIFPGCSFSPLAHYHCMWSLKPGIYCGEVVHTGSSLMRPHYEKHKQNPDLESIHISAVTFAEAQSQSSIPSVKVVPSLANPAAKPSPKPASDAAAAEGAGLNGSAAAGGTTPVTDLLPSASAPGVAPGEGFLACEPDVCTVEDCPHRARQHYHCTRGDCQFATESQDMLRDHKVNESVIFQSFRQMSRKLDCRRPGCKYNLLNKHYHCLHQGCNFSFLQIQQMESHGRKHMRRIYGKHFNKPGGSLIGPQQLVIPMVSASSVPFSTAVSSQIMLTSAAPDLALPSVAPSPVPVMTPAPAAGASPGAGLMSAGGLGLMNVEAMVNQVGVSQLGVPIQVLSSQAATGGGSKPLPPFMIPLSPLDDEDHNGNHHHHHHHQQQQQQQQQAGPSQSYGGLGPAKFPSAASLKSAEALYSVGVPRKRSLNLIEEDPGAPSGYKRYKRGPLDSLMMDRFRRYDRSEACCEETCQFSRTTTHYHCLHEDCSYRFAGKTMMYKHAQHHDRVNSIIQNDFRRFKASSECEQVGCPYQGNSTHFHCLRCAFVCTDSGKVAVHRKQHLKTDTISAAGFKQYSSADPCGFAGCKYTLRYSHFHCNRDGCTQGVIGMTQMETHRRRHLLNVRV